jgi:class 3 adenylate cyclase/tetratricopeptide (TPR) repeat protein
MSALMSERDELLRAIQALEMQRGILGDAAVDTAIASMRGRLNVLEREPSARREGERKQVTVMFADISGFTALAEKTDAEEVRNLVNACFERVGRVATRYGGFIDKFIGDELMVLFGAPAAMEDHAFRCLYAALEVRDALASLNESNPELQDHPLALHLGINSGLVVAGAIGTDAKREYTVMGDPVNVAARLVARAKSGEILVGAATSRLVGGRFEFEALGPMEFKGRVQSLDVYRLVGARAEAQQAARTPTQSRMIGRANELNAIQQSFEDVITHQRPRSVAVVGPAGIGKSRLQREFRQWLGVAHPEAVVLRGASLPHMTTTPYFLVADLLRDWLGVKEADSAADVRQRLQKKLAEADVTDQEVVHALGDTMGVEFPEARLAELAPEERKQRIFTAVVFFVEQVARGGPVLLLFEDLHWADDRSLDLLGHIFDEVAGSPVLFLTLSRPVPDPGARLREVEARLPRDLHRRVILRELDEGASYEMVASIAPGIGDEIEQAIVNKSQGNPFFIEEIIGSLLDQGVLTRDEHGVRTVQDISTVSVPDSVWNVLAERIDRLPSEEKQVIQSAAIVGRLFWEGLVSDLSLHEPRDQLRALGQREFVYELGPAAFANDREWYFRHVLVQEVAYSGLLKATRKSGHLTAARWLEERVGDRRNEYFTILAHHYNLGEDWARTADYSELAGERAASLFAHREAKNSYLQALDALERLPSSAGISSRRIDITLKLADVTFYAPSEDVHDKLVLAQRLAETLDEPECRLRVDAALASWLYVAGQNAAAVRLAEQCVAFAGEDLDEFLVVPLNIIGRTEFAFGNFRRCIEFLERSRNITQRVRQQHPWAEGPGQLQGFLGLAYALSGDGAKGEGLILEALALAEANHDLRRIAAGHMYISIFRVAVGKLDGVQYHLQEAIRLAEETGDSTIAYVCLGYLGEMHALKDELREAAEHLDRSLAIAAQLDTKAYVPLFLAFRAEVDLRAGRFESALRWAKRAVEIGPRTTEALRILGWAVHFSAPASRHEAEAAFRASAEFAKKGGAVVFYVRTISDYAVYLRIVGDDEAALALEEEAVSLIRGRGLTTMPIRPPIPSSSGAPLR